MILLSYDDVWVVGKSKFSVPYYIRLYYIIYLGRYIAASNIIFWRTDLVKNPKGERPLVTHIVMIPTYLYLYDY